MASLPSALMTDRSCQCLHVLSATWAGSRCGVVWNIHGRYLGSVVFAAGFQKQVLGGPRAGSTVSQGRLERPQQREGKGGDEGWKGEAGQWCSHLAASSGKSMAPWDGRINQNAENSSSRHGKGPCKDAAGRWPRCTCTPGTKGAAPRTDCAFGGFNGMCLDKQPGGGQ